MTYATGALTHNRVCESIKPGGAREGRDQSAAERVLDGSEVKGTFANAYLGVQLTVEGTSDYEVKGRIRKAEAARNESRSFLCDSRLPLALPVQLLRVRVFSVLLYSAESWDLSDDSLCRTLKHFSRRCMATLMKKEVQFISAKECSMADPVQAARQL